MASKPISITLPEAMLKDVERASRREHRTRSELIREALRHYLYASRLPVVETSARELAAVRRGERDLARGDYVTHEQLDDELAGPRRQRRST